jgi:hypothetical protein
MALPLGSSTASRLFFVHVLAPLPAVARMPLTCAPSAPTSRMRRRRRPPSCSPSSSRRRCGHGRRRGSGAQRPRRPRKVMSGGGQSFPYCICSARVASHHPLVLFLLRVRPARSCGRGAAAAAAAAGRGGHWFRHWPSWARTKACALQRACSQCGSRAGSCGGPPVRRRCYKLGAVSGPGAGVSQWRRRWWQRCGCAAIVSATHDGGARVRGGKAGADANVRGRSGVWRRAVAAAGRAGLAPQLHQ